MNGTQTTGGYLEPRRLRVVSVLVLALFTVGGAK